MTSARQAFLERVRQAVQAGNKAGIAPQIEAHGQVGYQGGGDDLAATFCERFAAAGGQAQLVVSPAAAVDKVIGLVHHFTSKEILLGSGAFIDSLPLQDQLRSLGVSVHAATSDRDRLFAADLSITGADYLIAETGSVVVFAKPSEPRGLSLLPPIHIVVASVDQIVPDLFDLFELASLKRAAIPSCVCLITGPSRTGDIELTLVTGVHGPGEVHLILVNR